MITIDQTVPETIFGKNTEEAVPTLPTDGVVLSEVKLASTQPLIKGFPFVIFAPEALLPKLDKISIIILKSPRVKARKEQPVFFRTDIPMVRFTMNHGDAKTATTLYEAMHTLMPSFVFKNWL